MVERNERGAAPAAGLDPVHAERERIRAALVVRCGLDSVTRGGSPFSCRLNRGHIGDCYPIDGTISITKERLEEILDG